MHDTDHPLPASFRTMPISSGTAVKAKSQPCPKSASRLAKVKRLPLLVM